MSTTIIKSDVELDVTTRDIVRAKGTIGRNSTLAFELPRDALSKYEKGDVIEAYMGTMDFNDKKVDVVVFFKYQQKE